MSETVGEAVRRFFGVLKPLASDAELDADLAEPMRILAKTWNHSQKLEEMTGAQRRAYAEAFVSHHQNIQRLSAPRRAEVVEAAVADLNMMASIAARRLTKERMSNKTNTPELIIASNKCFTYLLQP